MTSAIDVFLDHEVWRDTHRARLVPLGESASVRRHGPGEVLFKRFHPADQLLLLRSGAVGHETSGEAEEESWPMGDIAWPWGALGWSGFLPARRNGTTARTRTNVELLGWRHDDLARIFYSDPLLAVDFFRIVLDSARRQFEWIRSERLAAETLRPNFHSRSVHIGRDDRREFAPGIVAALRRSAFFAQFDDSILRRLAADAELTRSEPSSEPVQQDESLTGLWVLAGGSAESYFRTSSEADERSLRFLSLPARGGVAAGVPTLDGGYRAETTVRAVSACWFYRIPTESIEALVATEPEFGRSFMQRQLARLIHLITAARVPRPRSDEEPEIVALKSVLQQNQTRIPVTSQLHKVPHLLAHRLTTESAFACLDSVRDSGGYEERAVARVCADMLSGVQAEVSFYRGVLDAYAAVTDATHDAQPAVLRRRCDEIMAGAFSHLRTTVEGTGLLPRTPGHIVIINHLCCPIYYQLPNDYHFSFDTAFVSVLLQAHYGDSPVRVVRQSPGAEYGHSMFYSRLGHITVPTLESGIEAATPAELETLRREAADALYTRGAEAINRGENVLICPEGQCQKSVNSPARFYSGAFRLALNTEPEPLIVPMAIAGFDRRFKDVRLVVVVQPAFRLSQAMADRGTKDLRVFLDDYRAEFAVAVRQAEHLSRDGFAPADTDVSSTSPS